jgi:O-antigen ligase
MLGISPIGSRALRWWFLVGSGLGSFALILTLSRGAWLGALAGLMVIALFRSRKLLLLLALFAATYPYWAPQQAVDRVAMTTQVGASDEMAVDDRAFDDSTQMRVEQYRSFGAMVAPRPILGWGYKSFPSVFERYGTLGRAKGAHSTYLLVGVEQGIVGLLVLGFLFLGMGRSAWRASRACEDPLFRWMSVGLVGGTVAMVICMASGSRFENQMSLAYYWIFLGIVERQALVALSVKSASRRGVSSAPDVRLPSPRGSRSRNR